ncbi:uncharacterized protein BDZ99DRAFT_528160 [Mytilinidion resinicola]|uniref:Uncharacterized protein n=1 Tax=Mytilinidion resinicola TaxID=574789 RepID=A0A6A6XZ69_9PEZI|nr:uncharacterized protein BDZ99DRAFT_528160 [Mytilinidion resinicola]KAF2801689.1 hypothetical protein BDZ99DRAFT_528160 [Mytilinidion resinicola]
MLADGDSAVKEQGDGSSIGIRFEDDVADKTDVVMELPGETLQVDAAEGDLPGETQGQDASATRPTLVMMACEALLDLDEAGGRPRHRSCPPPALGNRAKEVAAKKEELEDEAQKKRSLYLNDIELR